MTCLGLSKYVNFFCFFFLCCFTAIHGQTGEKRLRILFYNVENLFDTEDNPMTQDDEFLPGGVRRWTDKRYNEKLKAVSKVIISAGDPETPAIIGLCEVENRKVIEDLLQVTPLNKHNFDIIHSDSDDPRGIDVCILYRRDCLELLSFKYLYPFSFYSSGIRTRQVLYSKWLAGDDTLHLFLNHWPSRRRGVLYAEDARITLARMIREMGDSIIHTCGECSKIIFSGDFNCMPGGNEMKILEKPLAGQPGYVNLCSELSRKGYGTYKFGGIWEMPDQFIVSESLLRNCNGIRTNEDLLTIMETESLLVRDRTYPGYRPFSTFRGYTWQGGFSDHLPIILDLIISSRN